MFITNNSWIVYAFVAHALFLCSIFVIYFRSPVLTGLTPQADLNMPAPANRLVLIVTDGLRAESFFRENCMDIPNIHSLFLKHGIVGISKTRVPTESRPGHIALISGLYEDPSAVLRGWKENPVNFDTLFNRSNFTYAFGAHDVLHIFSKVDEQGRMLIDAYNHDLDFSGSEKTFNLDKWVFEKAKQLINRKKAELKNKEKLIFFLHLLGLDTAGHVHKPGTPLFLENLRYTERAITEFYEFFEQIFDDQSTAYVLTSDHGMTNSGSHGAGDPLETETPFYLWGAGFLTLANIPSDKFESRRCNASLHELEQAQLTPLMASVLGLPPPMNNFGILPKGMLNVSTEYEARAAHSNALQLGTQFKRLFQLHKSGLFSSYLPSFLLLNEKIWTAYERDISHLMDNNEFNQALDEAHNIMTIALEGIEYYRGYYQHILLVAISITFLAWIYYLLLTLNTKTLKIQSKSGHKNVSLALICIWELLLLSQQVPYAVNFYLLIPVIVCSLMYGFDGASCLRKISFSWKYLLMILLSAEMLILAFFRREFIAFAFIIFGLSRYKEIVASEKRLQQKIYAIALSSALAVFPVLPIAIGYTNIFFNISGIVLILLRFNSIYSTIQSKSIIISTLALGNSLYCAYQHGKQDNIPSVCHLISWTYLIYVIYSIYVTEKRLQHILYHCTCLYSLFCTSYECIFLVLLITELSFFMDLDDAERQPVTLSTSVKYHKYSSSIIRSKRSFMLAYSVLLYTFISFFGTGNIMSISSFDPNITRCFLSSFSPFTIMALVILKLTIPVILIICIIFGHSSFSRQNEKQIFICILLICDFMGIHFLFFVRNTGSWLDVGMSISHFVIMQCTTLVLVVFNYIAKILLKIDYGKTSC